MEYILPQCGCQLHINGTIKYCPMHASAPDMYEALIWVAEWLGIWQPDGEKPNRADVIRIVNEALAKAEEK